MGTSYFELFPCSGFTVIASILSILWIFALEYSFRVLFIMCIKNKIQSWEIYNELKFTINVLFLIVLWMCQSSTYRSWSFYATWFWQLVRCFMLPNSFWIGNFTPPSYAEVCTFKSILIYRAVRLMLNIWHKFSFIIYLGIYSAVFITICMSLLFSGIYDYTECG